VNKNPDTFPPHYRRNFVAFLVDYVCFGVAFNFFNPTSVLPAFVGQLTTSAPVVGLASTIFRGGWLLPQLAVARLINDKPRKKPCLLIGTVGRAAFWVIGLALWAGLARYPSAMLALFFAAIALFSIGDGTSSVAWFDLVARAVPAKRRARLFGAGQVISGVLGIGAGALMGLILDSPRFAFPNDYALIFGLAGVVFIPSFVALFAIREPAPESTGSQSDSQVKGGWFKLLSTDSTFLVLTASRILVGLVDIATPFYVGHASEVLGLPESVVGEFVIAQTVAGVIASVLLSLVRGRWGARLVIRIGSVSAMLGPLFALVAHLVGGGWLARAYPFVYVAIGILNSTWMLGFFDYLLEIAPDGMRPAYVGLSNTIMGVTTLAPVAGGWLLEATSYTALFGLTSALVGVGFVLALGLRPLE